MNKFRIFSLLLPVFLCFGLKGQVVINEGSNRNYSTIADENGEYPDWVELYNTGTDTVDLINYSITDKSSNPTKWIFPDAQLAPGQFKTIFCSGKDRKPLSGFIQVANTGTYKPVTGWNTHSFITPFYWDGISNILINTCSYSSAGYTSNSVFNQSSTAYFSTSFGFMDGSPASCSAEYGTRVYQRPNVKLNDVPVGAGQIQNSPTDYPAPYGNWYWGARHQMLIRGSELTAAGLTPGYITSIAFDVVSTDPNTIYDYIDIYMKLVSYQEIAPMFEPVDTNIFLHTNFKISEDGETVYLYSPDHVRISQLFVDCHDVDVSRGSYPDASPDIYLFQQATPSSTNNFSAVYSGYLLAPVLSTPSGFFEQPVSVTIQNPNTISSVIHYTLDGSDPSEASPAYNGNPITMSYSAVLKSRAFSDTVLPSPIATASYLFGADHTTPILSVVTDNLNLYGSEGIFDNWWYDWERAGYVEYFDSLQNLIFSQRAGLQMDGGWGGSRAQPQHSFRVELDDGVLGDGPIYYPLIPYKPDRLKYSKFYLRNGSNQYLVLPYKDACQVASMGSCTHNYHAAWRPVSVYINGYYFGLYELREKVDLEYFQIMDGADEEKVDILSQSAWNGSVLRAVEGSVDPFYDDCQAFNLLDPADIDFWEEADEYFDMIWYTDYIIGESWMGNTDWPWNNIKIYRSDKTGYRWRFCLMDMELAMLPNGWTDCNFDHIQFMRNYDPNNPYINIWLKAIQNERYRNYFINRFADVMNSFYKTDRVLSVENNMYAQTVVEMQHEYARWGDPNHVPEQMDGFHANHLEFSSQLSLRTEQVRNHIQSNFTLPNQVEVTLNVFPEEGGKIKISTITPEVYPWEGVYFNGIPVKIEAVPSDGYHFVQWGNNGLISDTLNTTFLDTLNANAITFDAFFSNVTTSTDHSEPDHEFILYPNPATDILHLKTSTIVHTGLTYQLMDLTGRQVLKGALSEGISDAEISIRPIPPSIYLLEVRDNNNQLLIRFRVVKSGN
ncbi:MAG TPA: CotH kinase family protein [Bacteroidales bacterium]|nr:CotH kinase family protein [Bacteroidales bacterium]